MNKLLFNLSFFSSSCILCALSHIYLTSFPLFPFLFLPVKIYFADLFLFYLSSIVSLPFYSSVSDYFNFPLSVPILSFRASAFFLPHFNCLIFLFVSLYFMLIVFSSFLNEFVSSQSSSTVVVPQCGGQECYISQSYSEGLTD